VWRWSEVADWCNRNLGTAFDPQESRFVRVLNAALALRHAEDRVSAASGWRCWSSPRRRPGRPRPAAATRESARAARGQLVMPTALKASNGVGSASTSTPLRWVMK
jgi:hypothetical protein